MSSTDSSGPSDEGPFFLAQSGVPILLRFSAATLKKSQNFSGDLLIFLNAKKYFFAFLP